MHTRPIALLGAAVVAAACGGDRRDAPVATTTAQGTTAAPSTATSEQGNTTQVRLVSALPAQPTLDLAAGDDVVFSAVPYRTVTPFREIEGNAERFTLRRAGAGAGTEVLADNAEAMADGSRYTIVALPGDEGKGAQLRVLKDELAVDSGKVKLRVIHAAPNVGDVDVAMAGSDDVLFDDVAFGREAGFTTIDPVAGTLEIRRDDDDRDAKGAARVRAPRLQLEAGRAYTVVIAGADPKRPEFITFVDEPIASSSAAYASPGATGGPGTTTGGPIGAGNEAGTALRRDPGATRTATTGGDGAMGGRGEAGRTGTGTSAGGGRDVTGAAGTANSQKAGTMDRDRAGSTDEGTPPTTGSERGTTRSPS
jgi:hypothetical protein